MAMFSFSSVFISIAIASVCGLEKNVQNFTVISEKSSQSFASGGDANISYVVRITSEPSLFKIQNATNKTEQIRNAGIQKPFFWMLKARKNYTKEIQEFPTTMSSSNQNNKIIANQTVNTSNFIKKKEGKTSNFTFGYEKNVNCPPFFYPCSDNATCVPAKLVCDNRADCPNGSDELKSICQTQDLELIVCHNGDILKGHNMICNNVSDCKDGSDEIDCESNSEQTCDEWTQFSCMDKNDTCIDVQRRCDGVKDCDNGLDEFPQLCGFKSIIKVKTSFTFKRFVFISQDVCDFQCTNGQCISSYQQCDGTYDCYDGSDETQCDQTSYDKENVFHIYRNRVGMIAAALSGTCFLVIFVIILLSIKKKQSMKIANKKAELKKVLIKNHFISYPPSYEDVINHKKPTMIPNETN